MASRLPPAQPETSALIAEQAQPPRREHKVLWGVLAVLLVVAGLAAAVAFCVWYGVP